MEVNVLFWNIAWPISSIISLILALYVTHIFSDLQAATPAAITQNDVVDDEDDEPLNENDDDDDLDDVDQGEDLNTQHLVLAQFDKVMKFLLVLLKPASYSSVSRRTYDYLM